MDFQYEVLLAGVVKKYIGETSKSGKERGGEHYSDYHRQVPDSHMLKHQLVDHDGAKAHFEFKVLSSYRTALRRQIAEAVEIRREGEACLLNSKGMYNRCSLPRLVVEDDRNKEKPGAGQACDIPEEDWRKLDSKRGPADNQKGIGGRRKKKLKLDDKSLKEDNPRHEGLQKRKMNLETEFERECKRLRPEFDIDRELLFFANSPDDERNENKKDVPAVQCGKPSNLFDIFLRKTLPKTNPKISTSKPKKSKPPGPKEKSLTHSATQKTDIRSFFNSSRDYEAIKLPFSPAAQLPIISHENTNPKIPGRSESEKVG